MPLKHAPSGGNESKKLFLKTWELLQFTNWSKSTLYRYIRKGLLHPTQLCKGGSYLFPVDEVEALMGRSLA